jgi:hypothetical protein
MKYVPKSQLIISQVSISPLVGWEQAQFHTPCLNDQQVCCGVPLGHLVN